MVILPMVALVLTVLSFRARGLDFRKASLGGGVCFGLAVALSTEALSAISALDFPSLAVFWAASVAAAAAALRMRWSPGPIDLTLRLSSESRPTYAVLAAVLLPTLVIALVSPPNNFDSMTYHMARVVHWIQNKSVAHYPTHITRQLYSGPGAEYLITHFQILSGGDRFANLVQWLAMCGCLAGTSLIAEELGACSRARYLAMVVTATIPMGILQATSTQNDYVVAFWLVCFVYFGMVLRREPNRFAAIGCASSLGLAILTKGTAYIFALPFLLCLGITGLKSAPGRYAGYLLLTAALLLVLNGGHYRRNYAVFGSPLSTDTEILTNQKLSPKVIVSNLFRNAATNLWTPFDPLNRELYAGVKEMHRLVGQDPSDPATSFNESFEPARLSLDEDYAGNAVHLVLALAAGALILLRHKELPPMLLQYLTAVSGAALLFCALIKWQPWGTRLELPLFVLAAPLIAQAFPKASSRKAWESATALAFICCTPWLFFNETRPLLGERSIFNQKRESLYFAKRPQLGPYYLELAEEIGRPDSCQAIGLTSYTSNSFEYPLWALIAHRASNMPRLEHVHVTNASGAIAAPGFNPCAKVTLF